MTTIPADVTPNSNLPATTSVVNVDSSGAPVGQHPPAYGGLPASEYADIVNYLQGKPVPAWFDGPHSWNFRSAESTFSLDDQGLLLRKGRYVLQDWESERILTKMHVDSGHMKPALSFPIIQRTFTYAGGTGTETEYEDDCARSFTNCKLCGGLAHLALFKKIDGRFADVRCVVKPGKCGRGLDVVLEGIDAELVRRHRERLRLEFALASKPIPMRTTRGRRVPERLLDDDGLVAVSPIPVEPIFPATFGGLPASEYADIVSYLRDGTTPAWFDSPHPWKFRATEVYFSLNEHGLLMRKGSYVLQDWETENLLEKLHVDTGHMKSGLLFPLVKGKFVFTGVRGHHKFGRDLDSICTRCHLCRGWLKSMISKIDSVEFTKLRCVVRPAASGRGLQIVVEGVDEEKRREHNDRLEEEWILRSDDPVRKLGKSAKRICPSESSESINKNPRIHPETESSRTVKLRLAPVHSPVLLPVEPVHDRATVSLLIPDDIKNEPLPAVKSEPQSPVFNNNYDTLFHELRQVPNVSKDGYNGFLSFSKSNLPDTPEMEQEIKSKPQQKDNRTANELWDTETPTSSFNQYVESDCAVADPAFFFVCTPSGNIKCPDGFVPSQPSHKITKKMLTDGKSQLLMRAFMTRRSGDIPVEPREPEMLFEDSQRAILSSLKFVCSCRNFCITVE